MLSQNAAYFALYIPFKVAVKEIILMKGNYQTVPRNSKKRNQTASLPIRTDIRRKWVTVRSLHKAEKSLSSETLDGDDSETNDILEEEVEVGSLAGEAHRNPSFTNSDTQTSDGLTSLANPL